MSVRTAARLAWSLWAATLALVASGLVLGVAGGPRAPFYAFWVEDALIGPTFATLGALIVSRRPGNVIGWIFLACGAGAGVQMLSGQYATMALHAQTASGGAVAALLSNLAQFSIVFSVLFLVMLFPTGRMPSPRWRPLAWTSAMVAAVSMACTALAPGPIESFPSAQNPFGVDSLARVLVFLDVAGGWAGVACFAAAVLSLVLRFYRSRGEERLQLKWFAYAATLGFLAIVLGDYLVPVALRGWSGVLFWTLVPVSLPVCAGIAILRYRLYEIDAIINRTLVYGALTLMLASLYFGGVVVLQYALRATTGGESSLAVVASTLAIAALFSPLRRRVQSFVDRRFYRRKYDARRILADFSATLRDETDLGRLDEGLISAVTETVQPEHASLWLRPEGRPGEQRSNGRVWAG